MTRRSSSRNYQRRHGMAEKIISGAMVFSLSFLELFHVGVDLRAAFRSHLCSLAVYTVCTANQSAYRVRIRGSLEGPFRWLIKGPRPMEELGTRHGKTAVDAIYLVWK